MKFKQDIVGVSHDIKKHTKQNCLMRLSGLGCYTTVSSPYGNRTHDSAVRGRRLNLLTNEPFIFRTETVLAYLNLFVSSLQVLFLFRFFIRFLFRFFRLRFHLQFRAPHHHYNYVNHHAKSNNEI